MSGVESSARHRELVNRQILPFLCFTQHKNWFKDSYRNQTRMKKILLLAALLIGSISAAWPADHRVGVSDFQFQYDTAPPVLVGDTVTFVWRNGMHTTTSVNIPEGARPWNAPIDVEHPRFRIRLTVAGTYNFQCNFHFRQGMTESIVVSAASPNQVPAVHEVTKTAAAEATRR